MARKFTYGVRQHVGFAMEQCEEKLLIAYFAEITSRVRAGAIWRDDFNERFYDKGEGVSMINLGHINSERKRLALPLLEIIETHVYDYARSPDRVWKADCRRHLRDEYLNLNVNGKATWVTTALNDVILLPPPHFTHEELTLRHDITKPLGTLSLREQVKRQTALNGTEVKHHEPVISSPSEVDRAIKLLLLAIKPKTASKLIAKLAPDHALAVVESGQIENETLIDLLVSRSMD